MLCCVFLNTRLFCLNVRLHIFFNLSIYHNIYLPSIYSGLKKNVLSNYYNNVDLTEAAKLSYDGRESVVGHTLQLIADGLR